MLLEADPVVRKVIFIVRQDLQYSLDTNQTTDIKDLKGFITIAANLMRNSFRLIGYYDEKDYTDEDDKKLVELFPEKEDIVFKMKVEEPEELESGVFEGECDFNMFCKLHPMKYNTLFCLTCGMSICSACANLPTHANHDMKEKLDYLNDTKRLVEHAFETNQNMKLDPKSFVYTEELILYLKKITEMKYFDRLVEMIRQLEDKCVSLVQAYNVTAKLSCESLQDNLLQTKRFCIRGLERLKKEIEIKRILRDEKVFLTFDTKYKEITKSQSEKIQRDIDNFKILNENIPGQIITFVENMYNKVDEFLRGCKADEGFKNITNKITDFSVNRTKEEQILSDLGIDSKMDKTMLFKKYGVRNSSLKRPNDSPIDEVSESGEKSQILSSKNGSKQKNPFQDGSSKDQKHDPGFIESLKLGIEKASQPSPNKDNSVYTYMVAQIQEQVSKPDIPAIASKTQQVDPPSFNPETFSQPQPNQYKNYIPSPMGVHADVEGIYKSKSKLSKQASNLVNDNLDNLVEPGLSEAEKKEEKLNYLKSIGVIFRDQVMAPIPGENSIKIYSTKKSPVSVFLMFPLDNCPEYFYNNLAYCNYKEHMFVSGGVDQGSEQQTQCFCVTQEASTYKVRVLCPLLNPKSNHSMIADQDGFIYAIGGYASADCERYNPLTNQWELLDNLKYERQRSILAIIKDPNGNSYLYVFFGINKDGQFVQSIERLNITNPNIPGKWEEVSYYLEEGEEADIKCYGCGIVHFSEDQILFCGGIKMDPITEKLQRTNQIVIYQISESKFFECESNIKKSCSFTENTIYFDNEGYFQLDDTQEGLSINISE